jgi:TolA-binding protein
MKGSDKIDRYLNGEMTPAEMASFNKALATNTSLAKEVASMSEIRKGLGELLPVIEKKLSLEEEFYYNSLIKLRSDDSSKTLALKIDWLLSLIPSCINAPEVQWLHLDSYLYSEIAFETIEEIEKKIQQGISNEQVFFEIISNSNSIIQDIKASCAKFQLNPEAFPDPRVELNKNENALAPEPKRKSLRPWIISLSAAASIILALGLWWLITRPHENMKLYTEYFSAYDFSTSFRTTHAGQSDFTAGVQAYQNKHYSEAYTSLLKIGPSDSLYTSAVFLSGISLMETENFDKAISCFNTLVNDQSSSLYSDVQWYLALCYLHTNDITKAKYLLEQLSAGTSSYKTKSSEILKSL